MNQWELQRSMAAAHRANEGRRRKLQEFWQRQREKDAKKRKPVPQIFPQVVIRFVADPTGKEWSYPGDTMAQARLVKRRRTYLKRLASYAVGARVMIECPDHEARFLEAEILRQEEA